MVISPANSIRFYKVDNELPNFDNRSAEDMVMLNHLIYGYCHRFYASDDVTIQVEVEHGAGAPTVKVYEVDGSVTTVAAALKTEYSDYDYYEFVLDMSSFDTFFEVDVTLGSERWRSNPVEKVESSDEDLLIQWNNNDNAFGIDYSTGIVHAARVEGVIRLSEAGGSVSVYDNMEEVIKLQEEVKRYMQLTVSEIPDPYLETLRIAVAHDNLFINEIQFVSEDLPGYNLFEGSNLGEFKVKLVQKNVLGLNTHDTGYDPDTTDSSMVLQQLNASGDFTLTVPRGYLIQSFTALYNGGTGVEVKLGSSIDASDIVSVQGMRSSDDNFTETVNMYLTDSAEAEIYVGISGVSADIDIHIILLKNVI